MRHHFRACSSVTRRARITFPDKTASQTGSRVGNWACCPTSCPIIPDHGKKKITKHYKSGLQFIHRIKVLKRSCRLFGRLGQGAGGGHSPALAAFQPPHLKARDGEEQRQE